ncbi:hypothetical protein E3T46_14910 [Cryobacterium sp. Hh11]|uniref:hypothetical protein n=1 Tax=Cryobacterium sp. Hh11 TaxID=2555868 RepID=UPI00106A8359|nr:hypothetical protein [Cryobacterium sp. Hh11]TFD48717.1 hypothetical protein E3T46_14910 [Cryobacterium sp. Hh11]
MNQITSVPTTTDKDWTGHTAACSVPGCVSAFGDPSHTSAVASANIHFAAAYAGDIAGLTISPALDTNTRPLWGTYVDIGVIDRDRTADELMAIGAAIIAGGEQIAALNAGIVQQAIDAAEAQAWFDARPNALNATVSEVVRGNREPVWPLILDGLHEMHEIACAKRAERRRTAVVATAAGFIVEPDSLLMKSLANGDNARDIDRGRFIVTVGASL